MASLQPRWAEIQVPPLALAAMGVQLLFTGGCKHSTVPHQEPDPALLGHLTAEVDSQAPLSIRLK